MKLNYRFFLSFAILLSSFQSFAQVEIIEKVFSSKPTNFRSEIEIIDTISSYQSMVEGYEATFPLNFSIFGADDFKSIFIYRHKTLNKCGLIVYGENKNYFTEPVADSIYFVSAGNFIYTEFTDEFGNYLSSYKAEKLNFIFTQKDKKDQFWEVRFTDQNYLAQNVGDVERAILKAVSMTEVVVDEYGSKVNAVFANLKTNQIINSSILNTELVAIEAYAYHYDYYGYDYGYEGGYEGEYGYEVEEATEVASPVTFESRLLYTPVEIIYMTAGDTISQLMSYSYVETSDVTYKNNVVPESFNGVWKSKIEFTDGYTYMIIEGDEVSSDLGMVALVVDAYDDTYEVATLGWNDVLARLSLSPDNQKLLEETWQGSKSEISFISATSWMLMPRFKEFILQNDEILLHIYLETDLENNLVVGMVAYLPQKIYSDLVTMYYDEMTYLNVFTNVNGAVYDLALTNASTFYYYSPTLGVAKKNVDKNGSLILTSESIGTVQLKTYASGSYYVGQQKLSWVGDQNFGENSKVVSIKQMPYKILDQSGNVLADDVAALQIENVQGLNLYQIYDSNGKVGILGPDGNWLVKKEYTSVSVLSASYSTGYDYYYTTRNFPIFFLVYQDEKCGLLDTKGNWIVPITVDFIEVCQNELIITKDGKVGIYSFEGKKILDTEYLIQGYYGLSTDCYSLDMYKNGPKVFSKNGLSGILDKDYNVIVPFEYTSLVATVDMKNFIAVNQDGKVGMIDMNNKVVVPFEYDFIYPFDYYYNRFVVGKDQKQGVIDQEGNLLIPIEHFTVQTSSDWASNVILVYDENYLTNAIDTTGKAIIESGCGYIYYYPAYDILYCGYDVTYSFYSRAGNLLYTKLSSYIDPYNCIEAVQIMQDVYVEGKDSKYGAFDVLTGDEILPMDFESLYPIYIDMKIYLVGTVKGKIGIYSMNGEEIIKPKGTYLDNYFYEYAEDGTLNYFVEISNKKGKSKIIQLPNN